MTTQTPTAAESAEANVTPLHVAIIMDGNGRWANARGKSRHAGHRAGTENIRQVVKAFAERGVRYLTLYAFSTENWNRPAAEIRSLMRILAYAIGKEVDALHASNVRLLHIGDLDALSRPLQKQVRNAIERTRDNDGITLVLAFNYGGRAEMVRAVQEIVASGVEPGEVDDALIAQHLYTGSMPDPDLVVRTAGEMRLSNFLIWQTAYSEYYSTPACWPEFDATEVAQALDAYARRKRRYGGLLRDELAMLV